MRSVTAFLAIAALAASANAAIRVPVQKRGITLADVRSGNVAVRWEGLGNWAKEAATA